MICSPPRKRGHELEAGESVSSHESVPVTGSLREITTGEFAADADLAIELRRVAGEAGLGRPLRHPRVQKSGLALAGHFYGVVPTRVQVLGETELSYLDTLGHDGRSKASRGFFSLGLSCVIVSCDILPPDELIAAAEATHTPLFVSEARSSRTINAVHALLDDRLAPQASLHGVLVDVFGIGVLLLGKSGIGKSECAIELVLRGHRLVADDVVLCDWRPPGEVYGRAAELLRNHVEVRGLGILDLKALIGVTSVINRKRIDLVVQLVDWKNDAEYDRLGLEDRTFSILGTPIRELAVPVRPGRDMGTIVELAARSELLRRDGTHSARDLLGKLEQQLVTRAAIDADIPLTRAAAPPGPSRRDEISPHDRTGQNESSAWIPVVRPKPGGGQ
jgi:HPr kinase/phosphorylase